MYWEHDMLMVNIGKLNKSYFFVICGVSLQTPLKKCSILKLVTLETYLWNAVINSYLLGLLVNLANIIHEDVSFFVWKTLYPFVSVLEV